MATTLMPSTNQRSALHYKPPNVREAIWQSLLEVELNKTYWRRIAEIYLQWDRNAKIFLAVISSGTVAAWITSMQAANLPINLEVVWKIMSGISAILAVPLPI